LESPSLQIDWFILLFLDELLFYNYKINYGCNATSRQWKWVNSVYIGTYMYLGVCS
jgi:hypothetical protein